MPPWKKRKEKLHQPNIGAEREKPLVLNPYWEISKRAPAVLCGVSLDFCQFFFCCPPSPTFQFSQDNFFLPTLFKNPIAFLKLSLPSTLPHIVSCPHPTLIKSTEESLIHSLPFLLLVFWKTSPLTKSVKMPEQSVSRTNFHPIRPFVSAAAALSKAISILVAFQYQIDILA